MNKNLINFTTVVAKIFEVMLWIGDAGMVIGFIALFAARSKVESGIASSLENGILDMGSFEATVIAPDGTVNIAAIALAFLAGIAFMGFAAMICRNIHLIFKAEQPFCNDNIRRVREIGIFAIAIPVAQIVLSLILCLVSPYAQNVVVDGTSMFFGLVVLCLSQFFKYGASLENDVDGLL